MLFISPSTHVWAVRCASGLCCSRCPPPCGTAVFVFRAGLWANSGPWFHSHGLGQNRGPHPIRALVPRVTGSVPFPWVTFLRLCPACSPLSVSWGGPAKAHRAHTLEQQTPTLSEAWRRTSEGRCRQSLWPRPLSWPWHCPQSLAAPG